MAKGTRVARRTTSRKTKRTLSAGQIHINATFNNTIVTVTDTQGNAVSWGSAGSSGFKGSRKSTPFAASLATKSALQVAMDLGLREADVYIKGPGPGRESALRAVQGLGLKVKTITDITPVPHNGCRPPKKRRV